MKGDGRAPGDVIEVECYAGHKAEERPTRFRVGGEHRRVENVIDRWAGEDHEYFKVAADDCQVYLLRYDRRADVWTLVKVSPRIGTQ